MKLTTLLIDRRDMVAFASYTAGQYQARARDALLEARLTNNLALRAVHIRTARYEHRCYINQIGHVRTLMGIRGGVL